MANISKWFGYPIYITKLENFEEINKKIVPIITMRLVDDEPPCQISGCFGSSFAYWCESLLPPMSTLDVGWRVTTHCEENQCSLRTTRQPSYQERATLTNRKHGLPNGCQKLSGTGKTVDERECT